MDLDVLCLPHHLLPCDMTHVTAWQDSRLWCYYFRLILFIMQHKSMFKADLLSFHCCPSLQNLLIHSKIIQKNLSFNNRILFVCLFVCLLFGLMEERAFRDVTDAVEIKRKNLWTKALWIQDRPHQLLQNHSLCYSILNIYWPMRP